MISLKAAVPMTAILRWQKFLPKQIQLQEVERLFYKGSLGNQIFLKSEKVFCQIHWIDSYEVNCFLSGRMKAIVLNSPPATSFPFSGPTY